MIRVIVWRHGRTAANAEDRVQGQLDVELDEVGEAQAAAAAARLARYKPDLIVASDLQRAYRTGQALADLTGLPIRTDSRLRERYFGDWQGLKMTEVIRRFPEAHAHWAAADVVGDCGLEELDDLTKRAVEGLQGAAELVPDGGTVVVATHGGTAKYGTAALLGWPKSMYSSVISLSNCHWNELLLNPERGWRLLSYNRD